MSKLTPEEGRLYVVSTPIGNFNDITLRALNVLREADLVLCENFKEAAALLKYFSLDKELDSITVKNEEDRYPEFIMMIEAGKTIALISDCGTPAFADPGNQLINTAVSRGLDVQVLPGATSIMTAMVRCGFDIERFYFAGFLSRTSPERVAELRKLSMNDDTFCLLETPYRLLPMLEDAVQVIPDRRAYLACNLTMKNETHHYGTIQELYDKFKDKKTKMEFVLVIQGNTSGLPLDKIKYIERASESGYQPNDRGEESNDDRAPRRDDRRDDRGSRRDDRGGYVHKEKRADRPRFPRASSPRRNEGRGQNTKDDGGSSDRPRFERDSRSDSRPQRREGSGGDKPRFNREARPFSEDRIGRSRKNDDGIDRPRFDRDDRSDSRPPRRDSRDGGAPSFGDRRESRPKRDDGIDRPRRDEDRPKFNRDDRGGERPPRRDAKEGDRPRFDRDARGGDRPRGDDTRKLPRRKDEMGRSQVQRRSRDDAEKGGQEVRNFAGWRKDDIRDKKPKNDNESKD